MFCSKLKFIVKSFLVRNLYVENYRSACIAMNSRLSGQFLLYSNVTELNMV